MNRRLIVIVSLASSSAIAMLAGACGGGDNSNADATSDATTSDASNADAVADTGNDTSNNDTGTADAGSDGNCAGAGCRACCASLYPDAAASLTADETTCACTTPGDCQTVCNSSLCAGKPASNGCTQCLRNADAGDCTKNATATCKADVTCAPLLTCLSQCVLPPKDAGGGG